MNISEKDKQVLIYVAAALVVFAAFFFGFRNFNEKTKEYRAKEAQFETEYNDLLEKQRRKAEYLSDTAIYNEATQKIIAGYTDGYSLENTIKYIYELEDNNELFINTFTISDGLVEYAFSDGLKQGIRIPISFAYEGTYDTTKKMIDYINSFPSKCSIDSFTWSYSSEEDVATGNVSINTYAVITPESKEPVVDIEMPIGNENIFMASEAYFSEKVVQDGSYIVNDNDLVLELVQPQANMASVSLGLSKGDDKPVTSKKNDTVDVEIVFSSVGDLYTVAYKVGNTSYPAKNYEDGVEFEVGDTIDILVNSTESAGEKDKVKASVTIINNTDKMVNVKVLDDEAGRFDLVKKVGRVKVYN